MMEPHNGIDRPRADPGDVVAPEERTASITSFVDSGTCGRKSNWFDAPTSLTTAFWCTHERSRAVRTACITAGAT
jgi:hypothetical protein